MTDNILEFKKPEKKYRREFLLNLNVCFNEDGEYEVDMEIGDFDDQTIYEALVATVMKYAMDNGLVEEVNIDPRDLEIDDTVH